jgi:methylamine utilization protein MauE
LPEVVSMQGVLLAAVLVLTALVLLDLALTLAVIRRLREQAAAVVRALRRGLQAPCRCFGVSETPLAARHAVRNGVLLAVAVTGLAGVLVGPAGPSSLAGAAVALLAEVVAGALVTVFDELVDLFTVAPSPSRPSSASSASLRTGTGAGRPSP